MPLHTVAPNPLNKRPPGDDEDIEDLLAAVRLLQTREETFLAHRGRPWTAVKMKIGLKRDGRITALAFSPDGTRLTAALGDRTITKKGPLGKEGFLVVASDGKNTGLFVDSWTAAPDGATIHCVASATEAAPIANVPGMSAWLEKICTSVKITGTAPIPAATSAAAKP